mmetsp:Transcript_52092/g.131658  ORF Transcript_52092/g.131658 Transcript_52092/m.131658 type:complete len:1219 (+) Transcript_52092:57-3713(+)
MVTRALMQAPCTMVLCLLIMSILVMQIDSSPVDAATADELPLADMQRHSDHRVIVRYSSTLTGESAAAEIEKQVHKLESQPNVVRAQSLPRLGMAVVSMASAEAGEQLMADLQHDSSVELAVPDTWVSAFDLFADSSNPPDVAADAHRALRAERALPAQCSAHPACRMRGLVGDCCPAKDGMMLSCCSSQGKQLFALQTYHGTYVSAGPDGEVSQAVGTLQDSEHFEMIFHADGNVSLRNDYGKYLRSDEQGFVRADSTDLTDSEKFEIVKNENGTVSFKSYFGKYLAAEDGGSIVANRVNASLWEQFSMQQLAAPGQRLPNDPAFSKLWGMHSYHGFDIDAPEAWQVWTGEIGKGITVAVIDTGIDYNHEDLSEQMWVNPMEIPGNGVDDDGNGYIDDVHGADFANEDGDPMDDQMHGTHCAGTIAGIGNNAVGVSGVAWRGVRLMALKFLTSTGSGRTSDAIRAIDYAVAHGARIASNSWGGGGSSSALRTAIERAEGAGMLFTAAAGNEASNNDEVPSFPANYDISNVISVASTTYLGEMSSFSCYGNSTVHVAAPGSGIYSTVPNNGYETLSGTSMATPHVSGLAALVWMYRPQLSMHQVRDIIIGSVRTLPALDGKVITGGLINAKDALEAAWAFDPPKPPAHAPQAIEFEDIDPRIGAYGGVVTITAAADESDIDYYRVYMVSGAGFQLEAVGEPIPATGEPELTMELNASFVPPMYARALVAVSGRASGEMPARLRGLAPHVDIEDYGLPILGPKSVSWIGDPDTKKDFVNGSLLVERATDEASITTYNVYWHAESGARGPMLGSIAAVGFLEPVCSGTSCGLINMNRADDGAYVFERRPYGGLEDAEIRASGPGSVELTYFDTEDYYDKLTIGDEELHGNLTCCLPTMELSDGRTAIKWSSDDSIHGAGWSFRLRQEGSTVELQIETSEVLGSGFEVVPAYEKNELMSGMIVVEISGGAGKSQSEAYRGGKRRLATSEPSWGRRIGGANIPASNDKVHPTSVHAKQQKEPWLLQSGLETRSSARVIWSAEQVQQLSPFAARHGRVRSSFMVTGLAEEACTKPAIRAAFVQALAKQLPGVEESDVRLVRALGASIEEARHATPQDQVGWVRVEFEIEPSEGAHIIDLDRIESQLILLSIGRRPAEKFGSALSLVLKASGLPHHLMASPLDVVFTAPQQLSPRMLAAAPLLASAAEHSGDRRLHGAASPLFV